MADIVTIRAAARDRAGKGPARAARRSGRVPGVIYGEKQPPALISIDPRELQVQLNRPGFFARLVNVEDRPALCDFHSVAEVRRGDLLLTVSTGGASPGLAARIRARLAGEFGPEWADRLAQLRGQRAVWRCDGRDLAAETDALLQANGWLA